MRCTFRSHDFRMTFSNQFLCKTWAKNIFCLHSSCSSHDVSVFMWIHTARVSLSWDGKRTFLTLYYLLFMKRTEVNIFCPNSTCTKLSSLSLCVFFLPDYFDLVSFSLMEKIPREKGRRMTTGGIKRVQIPSQLIGTRVAAYWIK